MELWRSGRFRVMSAVGPSLSNRTVFSMQRLLSPERRGVVGNLYNLFCVSMTEFS